VGPRQLLWPVALAAGLAAESAGPGFGDPARWVPDLLTGWVIVGCGLEAWARRPDSRCGALLALTGFAWFAGTAWSSAAFAHRGPLVQAILTFPSGRASGPLARLAIAAGYAAALVEPVWRSEPATLVLAAAIAGVAAADRRDAIGRDRRARRYALRAAAGFAGVLGATALLRLAAPTQAVTDVTLVTYELALAALAAGLARALVRAPWERPGVTDLVVDLGDVRSGSVRDALARALGDPTLEVGYRLADGDFVDAAGRPVTLPAPASGRAVTEVRRDDEVVAALVHAPAVLDDPALSEGVSAAARLAAANAGLQAEVRAQLAEVQQSRTRILHAGDDERRRLERRLHDTAERRLAALLAELDILPDAELEPIREQLRRAVADVRELAAGLHPRTLADGGLAGALGVLAVTAPVPVMLDVSAARLPPDVETAVYFLCSEALANIAKYAAASRAEIVIATGDGRVDILVADDGDGGANPARGTGLRGLVDRLEALGGTLAIESPPGAGTRLVATLPLRTPEPS
jgi:signal transduction histidine kinase